MSVVVSNLVNTSVQSLAQHVVVAGPLVLAPPFPTYLVSEWTEGVERTPGDVLLDVVGRSPVQALGRLVDTGGGRTDGAHRSGRETQPLEISLQALLVLAGAVEETECVGREVV